MSFQKVVDVPNSVTILPELLPKSLELARKRVTGVLNFTNPGTVSHNAILWMVRDYIDPNKVTNLTVTI
jgi:3,5-epimerase/4-reductase